MKNLSIGIDIRVLARGTRTGIEEYVLNLLPCLLPLDRNIQYKLFYNAFHKVKLDYSWFKLPNVELKEFKFPNRVLDLFRWPKIDKFLGDIDIFFSPHFLPIALPKNCKRVITFHDLSFKHHPEFFSGSRKLWHWLTFPESQAKKTDKIITDSQSTKEDLVKIYGIEPEKIRVIYLGISENFKQVKSNKEKSILYFGTIEPRKNIAAVIKAFEVLKNDFKDLKLTIAGAKGWLYKDIFKQVEKFRKDIIFTGVIDDKDKPRLYNSAGVFVYPSFFEGFGFPPLEAMACGVPTIVSNTSSLSEVVGNGAIMIDPYNVDELVLTIGNVLEDKDLRNDLITKGLKQAKKFDWNKTAKQILDIFYKLK